ncbi:hypothetical protein E8Q33_05290 [Methylophaga sp. SB9B]|uniref:hypothetical protein n=1 Tax=Methylophaga sp. SB9B TaxID=2570356 RepID=UPI0010A771B5|nr:hypothetical protein [Methylophaga sp. SB9B]THK42194.1 hypothetical protein E8Q33_05290 [Methylophaga sp. SB9B]
MDRGLINFFELQECGFYRIKDKKSFHIEGSLSETISLIENWLKGTVSFAETIPWDTLTTPNRAQIYCKAIHTDSDTQDSVFVLWKRFSSDNENLNGIDPNAKFGMEEGDSVKVGTKINGKELILGQPMYYWFIPELNIIASINFQHATASTEDACLYIKRCMDLRIDHPRKVISEGDHYYELLGKTIPRKTVTYRSSDGSYSLRFKFRAHTKELSAQKVNLKKLSEEISHLVVRETISTKVEENKHSLFKLYDRITSKQKSKNFTKQVEIIEEVSLTQQELAQIIEVYSAEILQSKSDWKDIGFKSDVNSPTKWFRKFVTKEHILLDDLPINRSYHSPKVILQTLAKEREKILSFIKSETKNSDDEKQLAVGK